MDDSLLVKKAQEGSLDAFGALVKKYQGRVCQIAYSFLHNYDSALDASQESFLKAFKAIKNFDSSFNFLTWLSKITVNHCLDVLRKNHHMKTVVTNEMDSFTNDNPAPDSSLDRKETRKKIMEIIRDMPVNYRTVLILKDLQEMSFSEISQILDINNSTLRWRLHMARKMFKNVWLQKEIVYDKH